MKLTQLTNRERLSRADAMYPHFTGGDGNVPAPQFVQPVNVSEAKIAARIQYETSQEPSGSGIIYYNIRALNPANSDSFLPINFRETRTEPLFFRTGDWNLSITRFTVPTTYIPFFLWSETPRVMNGNLLTGTNTILNVTNMPPVPASLIGQEVIGYGISRNTTVTGSAGTTITMSNNATHTALTPFATVLSDYYITATFGAFTVTVPVNYLTDAVYTTPASLTNSLDLYQGRVGVNDVQTFIDAINIALAQVEAALVANGGGFAGVSNPYLVFNQQTQLISLIIDKNAWTPDLAAGATLYFNSALFSEFFDDSFNVLYNVPLFSANPAQVQILVKNNYNNSFSATQWAMQQEYTTVGTWSGFEDLLFLTQRIPISAELIPTGTTLTNGTGANATQQIITDFKPTKADSLTSRSYLQFAALGPYRYTELRNTPDLRELDIQLVWLDSEQEQHPVILGPGEFLDIKMMFINKKSASWTGMRPGTK